MTISTQAILRSVNRIARNRWGLKHRPRSVRIFTEGNYTIALIPSTTGQPKAIGVAKRNCTDKFDPEIGIRIAYSRALRNLMSNADCNEEVVEDNGV